MFSVEFIHNQSYPVEDFSIGSKPGSLKVVKKVRPEYKVWEHSSDYQFPPTISPNHYKSQTFQDFINHSIERSYLLPESSRVRGYLPFNWMNTALETEARSHLLTGLFAESHFFTVTDKYGPFNDKSVFFPSSLVNDLLYGTDGFLYRPSSSTPFIALDLIQLTHEYVEKARYYSYGGILDEKIHNALYDIRNRFFRFLVRSLRDEGSPEIVHLHKEILCIPAQYPHETLSLEHVVDFNRWVYEMYPPIQNVTTHLHHFFNKHF